MSLTAVHRVQIAHPCSRALPRGVGLAVGAAVSLAMWSALIRLALVVFGA